MVRGRRRRWFRTGLALLLALLAGGMWWRGGEAPPLRYATRDVLARPGRVAALRAEVQADNREATGLPAWLLEPGVDGRRIAGRCVTDDRPLAGVRVELRAEVFSMAGLAAPAATTDADGAFDFGVMPAAAYMVVAAAAGFQPSTRAVNLRDPTLDPAPDALELELATCAAFVFGTVRDAQGAPVADGAIALAGKVSEASWFEPLVEVALQDDGSFALCRSERHMVLVRAPGYGTVWLRDPMPAGGFDVRLVPEATVAGLVVDGDDAPIELARVVLLRKGGGRLPLAQTVASRPDGRFSFVGVEPGEYELAADHGRHSSTMDMRVIVAPGEDLTGQVVRMQRCRALAGVVRLAGAPVAGVRAGPGYQAFTQSDGSFVIGCASDREDEFKVEGHDVSRPWIPAGADDLEDLVIEVEARTSIEGRVTADGLPVRGAIVGVGDPSAPVGLVAVFGESFRTRTDADGRFVLTGVPAGTHELDAWDPRTRRRSAPRTVETTRDAPVRGVELTLEHAAAVSGVVVDPVGTPVAYAEVHLAGGASPSGHPSLLNMGRSAALESTTDGDGAFRIAGLAAGSYEVRVNRRFDKSFEPLVGDTWPPIEVVDGRAEVNVKLVVRERMGLAIRGRVRYDDGANAPWSIVDVSGRDTVADAQGAFVMTDLAEGDHFVHATAPDGATGTADAVAGGGEVVVEVIRGGTVAGSVGGGAGSCEVAMTAAALVARGLVGPARQETRGDRTFRFEKVQPGDYRIEARCETGAATRDLSVKGGGTTRVELAARESGTIRGVVRGPDGGAPAADTTCQVGMASAVVERTTGAFELTNVQPGTVRVACGAFSGKKFTTGSAEVSVAPGAVTEVEIDTSERANPFEP